MAINGMNACYCKNKKKNKKQTNRESGREQARINEKHYVLKLYRGKK